MSSAQLSARVAPLTSWLMRVAPHDLEISDLSQALWATHFSCPPIVVSSSPRLPREGTANLYDALPTPPPHGPQPCNAWPPTSRSSGRGSSLITCIQPYLFSLNSPLCFAHLLPHITSFPSPIFLSLYQKFAQFSLILKNKLKLPIFYSNSCSISLLILLSRFGRCGLYSVSTPSLVSHRCSQQPPPPMTSDCQVQLSPFSPHLLGPLCVAGSTNLRLDPSSLDSTFWPHSFKPALASHPPQGALAEHTMTVFAITVEGIYL